jgi:hypothetical protein
MKQAVRALTWATSVFWIILLLFTVTVAYSALQIRPSFGEPSVSSSGDVLTTSLPMILYNGGFYDISKFNITTLIKDHRGQTITSSSTFVPVINSGANTTIIHTMSLSIEQAAIGDLSHLLFNDSELDVVAAVRLVYARAFPIEISLNLSMPWGAPFANLTIGNVSTGPLNLTHVRVLLPLSFENHSFLEMNGTVRFEIVDQLNHVVGNGSTGFTLSPENRFETDVEVLVSGDPSNIREAHLYLETTFFDYGPVVISLV